jgi:hypothetical protein
MAAGRILASAASSTRPHPTGCAGILPPGALCGMTEPEPVCCRLGRAIG